MYSLTVLALLHRYYSEHEAARAFDRAALCIYGELAVTNFGLAAARQDPTTVSAHIVRVSQEYERFRSEQQTAQNTLHLQQQQQQLNAAIQQAAALQQQQQHGASSDASSLQQLLLQHQQRQTMLSLDPLLTAQTSQPSLSTASVRAFSLPLPQLQQQQIFILQSGYNGFSDPLPQLQYMQAPPASNSPTASYGTSKGLTAADLLIMSSQGHRICSEAANSASLTEDGTLGLDNSLQVTTAELLSLRTQGLVASCPEDAIDFEGNARILSQLAAFNLRTGLDTTTASEGACFSESMSSAASLLSYGTPSASGLSIVRKHSAPREQLQAAAAGTSGDNLGWQPVAAAPSPTSSRTTGNDNSPAAAAASCDVPPPPPPRPRAPVQQEQAAAPGAGDGNLSNLLILLPEGANCGVIGEQQGNMSAGVGNVGGASGSGVAVPQGMQPQLMESLQQHAHLHDLDAMITQQQQQLQELQQLRAQKQQERVLMMQQSIQRGHQ
jgi:hypothetical protein